jgi:hypothetical protein
MSEQEAARKRRAHEMTIGAYHLAADGTRTEVTPTHTVSVRELQYPSTLVLPLCDCPRCMEAL